MGVGESGRENEQLAILVSILLPVKNGAQYISECIDSVINQSLHDWELIVVDDHSKDKTSEMVRKYVDMDPRIKIFSNSGSGVINALSTGLRKAKGIYVTRIDHDDLMPESRLELMYNEILGSRPKTVVTGLVKYFSDKPISTGYLKYENWINDINLNGLQWQNIYRECVIASPNWMVRKSDLDDLNGFDELKYPEDYHLVLKWYQNNFTIKCIPDVTLLWREHQERTSRNSDNYSQIAFFNIKVKEFLDHEDNGYTLVLWGSSAKGKLTASLLKESRREFLWMDLIEKQKTIDNYTILPYTQIETLAKPQLLISVYPEEKERINIETYLEKLGLSEGKNFWYL